MTDESREDDKMCHQEKALNPGHLLFSPPNFLYITVASSTGVCELSAKMGCAVLCSALRVQSLFPPTEVGPACVTECGKGGAVLLARP